MATNPIVDAIRRIGRRRREPATHIKAALETGRVESNFTNPSGGDADSAGWRQERASLYKNPTDVVASVNRFYDETDKLDHGQKSYDLAADVQRPAAQYRGRYRTASSEAQKLLEGGGASGPSKPSSPTDMSSATPGVGGATAAPSTRRAALQNYLLTEHSDPDALLTLALGLKTTSLPQKATSSTVVAPSGAPASAPTQTGGVDQIKSEAKYIDSAHVPYLWGGGHQAKQVAANAKVTALDCSGAVSRALGINPRVASQFKGFGEAGTGKRVTIYAKDTHVLLEVDGHFWGTSHSNPGGGAGWIPRGALPASYLSGFVARHPTGM